MRQHPLRIDEWEDHTENHWRENDSVEYRATIAGFDYELELDHNGVDQLIILYLRCAAMYGGRQRTIYRKEFAEMPSGKIPLSAYRRFLTIIHRFDEFLVENVL